MPTAASRVGPLELPLDPGAQNTPIDDPTVSWLAAYLAFWLRFDLNAKLANLQGTASDACPAGNIFYWNPLEPSATFVRGRQDGQVSPFPALYVWGGSGRLMEETLVYDCEEREIGVLWLFEELAVPGALIDRYGLRNAVAKTLERAIALRAHPAYSHNGGPPGEPIAVALKLARFGIRIARIVPGLMAPVPEGPTRSQGSDQPSLRAYPSVLMTLTVWERVEQLQPLPADAQGDVLFRARVNGADPAQTPLELGGRYLLAPDETDP